MNEDKIINLKKKNTCGTTYYTTYKDSKIQNYSNFNRRNHPKIGLTFEFILSDKNKALESLEFLEERAKIDISSSSSSSISVKEDEYDDYNEDKLSLAYNSSSYEMKKINPPYYYFSYNIFD